MGQCDNGVAVQDLEIDALTNFLMGEASASHMVSSIELINPKTNKPFNPITH